MPPIARRRRFSGAEKRRLLGEADRCTEPGQLGALLRREKIYSSMLANWRKQSVRADEAALAPRKRGPKPAANREEMRQVTRLTQENARLQRELERARTIIDVQKKTVHLARITDGGRVGGEGVMAAFQELSPQIGRVASTCEALQINRTGVYRQRARLLNASRPGPVRRRPRPRPPLSQTPAEQDLLLVCSTASASPMWRRLLSMPSCSMKAVITVRYGRCTDCWQPGIKQVSVVAREFIRSTPSRSCSRPSQTKCGPWDITKLKGPAKWTYFQLYVVLDIFSRYVRRLDARGARDR